MALKVSKYLPKISKLKLSHNLTKKENVTTANVHKKKSTE